MAPAARKLPDPIATLRNEHRYMTLLLGTITQKLREDGLKSRTDYYLIQDIARYMHEYPDVVHHPTEDALFERLVIRDPASKKEVERLRRDHKRLEASTAEVIELLDAASKEQTKTASDAVRITIERYIGRLQKHMQFEESVLFPRAIECLANSDWKTISSRLNRIEDPLFGQTVGRDYRPLYEYFSHQTGSVSRKLTKDGFLQFDAMIVSADALENGMSEMWKLMSDYAELFKTETRSAAKQIADDPGIYSILGTPLRLAKILGGQTIDFGSDAAGVYVRTAKQMVSPFLPR